MRKDFITFRSITPAQRGQRLLRQAGVEALLQRTPSHMRERGCGYCLRLDPADTAKAVAVFEQAGLSYSKIYPGGEVRP